MKKIVLAGLIHDTNIGDKVIYDNTKYLVEKALQELQIKDVVIESMDMTASAVTPKNNTKTTTQSKTKKIINRIITPEIKKKLRYIKNKYKKCDDTKLIEYYQENLKNVDLVIFVGGGIVKYLYQDFYKYITLIINVCDKQGTDVILNSVGVEGYSRSDYRCQQLKNALNKNCVKMITTRDDIDVLEKNYITNPNIILKKVADPAVWTYETYKENISPNKTDTIGLGVIRPGIFRDNEINFEEEEQLELWANIIKVLEQKGYNWQLFTNGLLADYEFGKKILEYSHITDESKLLDVPKNGEELVHTISKFKGVIAARMHANIISYSLDIPSIGIVWNSKLTKFGENIQVPERFVTHQNFKAEYIVEKLENALKEGFSYSKEEYKKTVYEYLKKGMDNSLNQKNHAKNIIVFDTAIGSTNKGDVVIFEALKKAFGSYLTENNTYYFPTHTTFLTSYQVSRSFRAKMVETANYRFVFGTSILKTNMMKLCPQWSVNIFNCKPLKNLILVGVGNARNAKKMNWYTKYMYKHMLSKDYVHSVRDEETKEMLESLGFKAINTGCPTLWGLTEKHCAKIPTRKAKNVVFALRGEKKDFETDKKFIEMLKKNYEKLFYWPQTFADVAYIKQFDNVEEIEIIPQSLEAYEYVLKNNDIDYVGLRLHGGIFAMQQGKRAIIVKVDHRASNIDDVNHINCVGRSNIDKIEEKINASFETNVFVDYEKINEWMSQFQGMELFKNKFENKE